MTLQEYNPTWHQMFEQEAEIISNVFDDDELADIQHIGSTAIPGMKAKPIIDIAVLVSANEYAQSYVPMLAKIGYRLDSGRSSVERLFFTKGEPVQFHLSLSQEGKTPYWERQLLFRDYLINHPNLAKEYEQLKEKLLLLYPEARQQYSDGKSEFVNKVLRLAKEQN